jgi:hypothetical protein
MLRIGRRLRIVRRPFWEHPSLQLSTIANLGSALSAFGAAVLWWRASRVMVEPGPHSFGFAVGLPGGTMDVVGTVQAGARLNARAAFAAAIAAALQGAGLLLALFSL